MGMRVAVGGIAFEAGCTARSSPTPKASPDVSSISPCYLPGCTVDVSNFGQAASSSLSMLLVQFALELSSNMASSLVQGWTAGQAKAVTYRGEPAGMRVLQHFGIEQPEAPKQVDEDSS